MPESISTYLHSLFIISLIGIVTEALLSVSSKNTKTLESALKLVFSLCLTLSVLIPGAQILRNTDLSSVFELKDSHEANESEQSIISLTKKQLEADVFQKIYSKFGIKPTHVSIQFVTEQNEKETNIEIESVTVGLSGPDNERSSEINEYAMTLLGLNDNYYGEE